MKKYSNFNGLYNASPQKYFQPETLEEFINFVKKSSKLRVIGGIHTFNDISIPDNDGQMIDTKYLNNVIDIDSHNKTVTTQSGIKLKKLLKILDDNNLTLPVMTATYNISIAGGISTGAHGSNILNGSLSSLVKSLEIITAEGDYKKIKENKDKENKDKENKDKENKDKENKDKENKDKENKDKENKDKENKENKDNMDIDAFRCGLGCLGAIYSVTLQCVDQFSIKETIINSTWSKFSQNIDKFLHKYPYTEINTDQFSKNLNSMIYLREKIPYNKKYGRGHKVLTGNVDSWYIEIELAFPFEIANTALKAVSKFHQQYKKKYNVYSPSFLFVRFSSADNTLISMASGRKTIYISSFFGKEYEPEIVNKFMQKLSDKMVDTYAARPHYGKQNHLNKERMAKLYGNKYFKFVEIKNKYDPKGKFSNNYIKRIL